MSKEQPSVNSIKIAKLLETYIPLKKREWYPWVWPEKGWWAKVSKGDKDEYIQRVRQLAAEDLFFFCDEIMRNPDDPHMQDVHATICHLLQNTDSDIGQLLPRNHLKSTITSVAYPLWRLARNPNLRIMIASDTLRVAAKFIKAHKAHILNNQRLKLTFPDLKPAMATGFSRYQAWNSTDIEIVRDKILGEPSITCLSAGTDLAGMHYDIHIYDDIVTQKSVEREGGVTKVNDWYEQSLNLLDRNGRIFVIGTRYIDGDIYELLMEKGTIPFYVRAVIEDGKYIWDDSANIDRVEKMRVSMSAYMFSCQYMNEPVVKGEQEFMPEWVNKHNAKVVRETLFDGVPPQDDGELRTEWIKSLDIYMSCDPARTDKKRSDYTAMLIQGVDTHGRMFKLDFVRDKLKSPDIVERFIELFTKWNPKSAGVETYGGDVHVYNDIKKAMKDRGLPYWKVFEYEKNVRMSGDDRIRALQMPYSQGLMYIGDTARWAEFEYELLRFPYGKHDDLITCDAYMYSQQIKPKARRVQKEEYRGWDAKIRNRRTQRQGSWMVWG